MVEGVCCSEVEGETIWEDPKKATIENAFRYKIKRRKMSWLSEKLVRHIKRSR